MRCVSKTVRAEFLASDRAQKKQIFAFTGLAKTRDRWTTYGGGGGFS